MSESAQQRPAGMGNMDMAAELRELATNLLWIWHPNTIAVFRDIDPALWRKVNHNPVAFLNRLEPDRLQERAAELALDAHVNYAFHRLRDYLEQRARWGDIHAGPLRHRPVAYFSAEFGLHESIPIYSGGLGTLSGDLLKSASDLGVPMVGIGLFYAQGYFNQHLDDTGWQQENYAETQIDQLPLERVTGQDGRPARVGVETRAGRIDIGLWRARVGRCLLLLLDTDVESNPQSFREITGRLYGGDSRLRILQELVLGVGGARALAALGIQPSVLHLNEGHSVFTVLEVSRQEMETDAIPFEDAFRRTSLRTVFTTHTPVEAGHDRFDSTLMEMALGPLRERLGLSPDGLMALGRVRPDDSSEPFCMTVLGLKGAARSNAVSALHGHVTRRMWRSLWPGRSESEIPIGSVTNGVHVASWVAPPMAQLYERCFGADWHARMCLPETWSDVDSADDGELWEVHQTIKARLISYVQRQVCAQEALRRGQPAEMCDSTRKRLNADILTLGFARRFATYKRADLILSDLARLERLVSDPVRPIQIVFAGKAHPRDDAGKRIIQSIDRMSRDTRFLGRIVFIEDYDINVARHMLQGVDAWLNTPRRPLEASGTSGMKAIFNGVLNVSILDGWWAEAYDGSNGFCVGNGEMHSDSDIQDRRDSRSLLDVIEHEVAPLYYERDPRGIPRGWVARMKNAIRTLAWRFNADRAVIEYARSCYLPLVGVQSVADGRRIDLP